MLASNPVSTIFRCMSCSFGTHDQAAYAEHIKHCSNESSTEPVSAEGDKAQSNLTETTKNYRTYMCKQCAVPMGCSRALLVHQRDVHGENFMIFICTLCSRYAARNRFSVVRHAKINHPKGIFRGRVYAELNEMCETKKQSADKKVTAVAHWISQTQELSCDQTESSIPGTDTVPCQVKFSRSLGLQFLGRPHPDIGLNGYICQLCGFLHVKSSAVVKHIRKNHADKFSDVTAEVCTGRAADGTRMTEILYRCDDCSYSCHRKRDIFNHSSHHHFEGTSKCPHCSYCTLNNAAVNKHVRRCHSDESNVGLSAHQPKRICTKVSASCKVAKRSDNTHRKYVSAQKHRKKKCPYCPFRSIWSTSVYKHKVRFHPEVRKADRNRSSEDSVSPVSRLKKTENADDSLATSYNCNGAEQRKPLTDKSSDATSTPAYTCDICSAKCRSLKHWHSHKLVHMDIRRYKCPLCGLRTNYMQNTKKHIKDVHKSDKASVITLSYEDAKQTIEAYRKQRSKLDCRQGKCVRSNEAVRSSKLLHQPGYAKAKAVKCSMSALSNQMLAKSTKHSSVPADRQTKSNSDTSHLRLPSRQKYACSVCKMQSNHSQSVRRHIRSRHCGTKAKPIIVKEKMSVHKSRLGVQRKTTNSWKHNSATSDYCNTFYDQDGKQKRQLTLDGKKHVDNTGAEFVLQNAKSEMHDMSGSDDNIVQTNEVKGASTYRYIPLQPSSVKNNTYRYYRYTCDICPYKSDGLPKVIAHKKSHVKRPGYSFACSICPYFTCQASILDRHMRLHAKESTDVDKKPYVNSELKARVHLCEHCPYMARCRKSLICHKQLHRPRPLALYKCNQCAFWVREPRHLTKHLTVHKANYLQKRMKYIKQLQTTDSRNDAVEIVPSHNIKELDVLPVQNVLTTDENNCDKMTQNKPTADGDDNTGVVIGVIDDREDSTSISTHSRSTVARRQLPSWCCEKCPYSSSKLVCFKRHMWLHGKEYMYECRYCDYSVQSYWQLVSHELWHFVPNKHLVYAQSVSNVDSFLSQLQSHDGIPDTLASVDEYIPSFENSDVFVLSDAATFLCDECPFVTEQRSELFTHKLCHCMHTEADRCPYCTFHGDRESLSAHIRLHFNLPGCQQSFLPRNVCHSEDWKRLDAAIEAIAQNSFCTESHHMSTDNSYSGNHCQVESASALECEVSDANSGLDDVQHNSAAHSTAASDGSLVDKPLSTDDNVTSVLINETTFCRYCDKIIGDPHALVKHEASHLIGFNQPATPMT